MRVSEMLTAIASWLESPNNEALLLAEEHEDSAKIVAEACVLAAELLKSASLEVSEIEPEEESHLTPESVEELASIASAFDQSGDEGLKKQASVIDELLLSVANLHKKREEAREESLSKDYVKPSEELARMNKVKDSKDAIDDSRMTYRDYRVLETPLSTRYCPDHPGVQTTRIGDYIWQCELDKKIYDFQTGFTLLNGRKVPGGDIQNQTPKEQPYYSAMFDTRRGRLGQK